MTEPLNIFICYAREDSDALEAIRKKLSPLVRSGRVKVWFDGEITGGKAWDDEIRGNLKSADIVLLLISDDFFDSDYINSVELREALNGHARKENVVVPVILYDCLWDSHPEIARLQALPDDAKPVFVKKYWSDPSDGFANAARGIVKILDDSETDSRRNRKFLQQRADALQIALTYVDTSTQSEKTIIEQSIDEVESLKKQLEAPSDTRILLPKMVFVQGSTFEMGEKGVAAPIHTVTLPDFEIGKYPVTQRLWQMVMGSNPSYFINNIDCPVENVSWSDAQKFLTKLNALHPGRNYRLPTEAEWEYAARGGIKSKHYKFSGSNDIDEVGWHRGNSGEEIYAGKWKDEKTIENKCRTHPVGQKKANELGLYDMSGNVWEWCEDWYAGYPSESQVAPCGPKEGASRVTRGGSWGNPELRCSVTFRFSHDPLRRSKHVGLRIAASPSK